MGEEVYDAESACGRISQESLMRFASIALCFRQYGERESHEKGVFGTKLIIVCYMPRCSGCTENFSTFRFVAEGKIESRKIFLPLVSNELRYLAIFPSRKR